MIGRLNDTVYSQKRYLQHSPQVLSFNYAPPGERLPAGPPNSPNIHTAPTSHTIPHSHPDSAISPHGSSTKYRPSFIPKAGDLWEDIQPHGEGHNYWGEPLLPLTSSRPQEGPLYTSPDHSPSRRTGDEVPGVQMSRGQRYPISDTHADSRAADSPPLGSLLAMRGVAAPPLVSLPPSKPSAIHESTRWYAPPDLTGTSEGLMFDIRSDKPLVSGYSAQGCTSPRSTEESYHAAFWETAGWTPEDGYRGFSEDGPRIPPYLKGKGRARLHDPKEGEETPGEQDSSGWTLSQPGIPLDGCAPLPSSFIDTS